MTLVMIVMVTKKIIITIFKMNTVKNLWVCHGVAHRSRYACSHHLTLCLRLIIIITIITILRTFHDDYDDDIIANNDYDDDYHLSDNVSILSLRR